MKKHLFLIFLSLILSGCVAVPMYESSYYYPYNGLHSYGYIRPGISVFVPVFHGGHDFHGGYGFHGGRR